MLAMKPYENSTPVKGVQREDRGVALVVSCEDMRLCSFVVSGEPHSSTLMVRAEEDVERVGDGWGQALRMSGQTKRWPVSLNEVASASTSAALVSWLVMPNASMTAHRPPL